MDADPRALNLGQPLLFTLEEQTGGVAELFPAVWGAAEALTHPDPDARRAALQRLEALDAPRLSPLVVYLIATRITDRNLEVRTQAVRILGGLLAPDKQGRYAVDSVQYRLKETLSQMRTRQVYALLQVALAEGLEIEQASAHLFNTCPYAGNHLMAILNDRKAPLAIRRKAVHFIGLVGYLEAIPALQRAADRLEARRNGQQRMPFAPPEGSEEMELYPDIQAALTLLSSP